MILAWAATAQTRFPKGDCAVVVDARDALTATPLAGAQIRLEGGEPGKMTFAISSLTGPDGSMRLYNLSAGKYCVRYQAPPARPGHFAGGVYFGQQRVVDRPGTAGRVASRSQASATRESDDKKLALAGIRFGLQDALTGRITIGEGGNPPLEITLTASTGRISGTIDREGSKSDTVYLRRTGLAAADSESIQNDGAFSFEDLAPGKYELVARSRLRPMTRSRSRR